MRKQLYIWGHLTFKFLRRKNESSMISKKKFIFSSSVFFFILKILKFFLNETSHHSLDDLSNKVWLTNLYNYCLEKFEKVSEVSLILNHISLCMFHSSQLYIDSLSCNQSLCTGIKAEGPINFKSRDQLLTVMNLKQYTGYLLNKLSIVPKFCWPLLFFLWDFFRASNIKEQTNIAKSIIKSVK